MLQGLGNLLGSSGYNQPLFGSGMNQSPLGGLGALSGLGNNQGLFGGLSNPISGLLSGGLKCSQNEQRLMQEKAQRNLLKKYLIQQTGDPIQSSLISSTIPGKGALDDFDVGLGTRSNILRQLGIPAESNQSNLLGGLSGLAGSNMNNNFLGSLGGNNSALSNLSALGNLSKLGSSNTSNPGLLSSLVSLASTPNNNGNILSSLGGLGTGLLGGGNTSDSGLLGNLQSGINTLNTINKVNNAISGVKSLF